MERQKQSAKWQRFCLWNLYQFIQFCQTILPIFIQTGLIFDSNAVLSTVWHFGHNKFGTLGITSCSQKAQQ
jgi:hypothetical protein